MKKLLSQIALVLIVTAVIKMLDWQVAKCLVFGFMFAILSVLRAITEE